jgi:hypothetical protein
MVPRIAARPTWIVAEDSAASAPRASTAVRASTATVACAARDSACQRAVRIALETAARRTWIVAGAALPAVSPATALPTATARSGRPVSVGIAQSRPAPTASRTALRRTSIVAEEVARRACKAERVWPNRIAWRRAAAPAIASAAPIVTTQFSMEPRRISIAAAPRAQNARPERVARFRAIARAACAINGCVRSRRAATV